MQGSSLLCSESSSSGLYFPYSTYYPGVSATKGILPEPSAFNLTSNWTTSNTGSGTGPPKRTWISIAVGVVILVVLLALGCWCECFWDRCLCFVIRRIFDSHRYREVPERSARRGGRRARHEEHELDPQQGNHNKHKRNHNSPSLRPHIVRGRGRGSPLRASGHPNTRHDGPTPTHPQGQQGSRGRGRGRGGK